MDREHGTGCVFHDSLRRTPHQNLSQLRMPARAHHDDIDVALGCPPVYLVGLIPLGVGLVLTYFGFVMASNGGDDVPDGEVRPKR